MRIDAQCQICSAQAFTADAVSEHAYDTGAAGRDITEGEPLGVCITVKTAAKVSDGNETYEFQVLSDDDEALGSPNVLCLRAIDKTLLTLGSRHIIPIPPGSKTLRYLGLNFNGGGTNPSVTVDAHIGPLSDMGGWKPNAKGYTVQ